MKTNLLFSFFKMFGLVTSHTFSFFSRFFRVIIKKYIRRINSSLFFYTGYNIANILYAFSVGSIFFFFFKLFFRIVETNPSWEINRHPSIVGIDENNNVLINTLRW